MPTIGALIRSRREELGMSASELARAIGATAQRVSNWERIPSRQPSKEILARLAAALQVSVEALLASDEQRVPTEEQDLLALYRSLAPSDGKVVLRILRGLAK